VVLWCPPSFLQGDDIAGLDIGCGASLIYPLLGAALNGWRFAAVDVTDEAIDGATANADANPHLRRLIDVRRGGGAAPSQPDPGEPRPRSSGAGLRKGVDASPVFQGGSAVAPGRGAGGVDGVRGGEGAGGAGEGDGASGMGEERVGDGILLGALRPKERFAFSMCNPPFFESMAEAGRNPSTAHSGEADRTVMLDRQTEWSGWKGPQAGAWPRPATTPEHRALGVRLTDRTATRSGEAACGSGQARQPPNRSSLRDPSCSGCSSCRGENGWPFCRRHSLGDGVSRRRVGFRGTHGGGECGAGPHHPLVRPLAHEVPGTLF
jgi:RNA methyltransferase